MESPYVSHVHFPFDCDNFLTGGERGSGVSGGGKTQGKEGSNLKVNVMEGESQEDVAALSVSKEY